MNTNFLRDKIHQFKKLNCIQSVKLPYEVDTLGILTQYSILLLSVVRLSNMTII